MEFIQLDFNHIWNYMGRSIASCEYKSPCHLIKQFMLVKDKIWFMLDRDKLYEDVFLIHTYYTLITLLMRY